MVLTSKVIEEAVKVVDSSQAQAIVIPEESFGEGFWSQVKAFERSFYLGDTNIEAPRFIQKKVFVQVGGYDENMVSGEDWDLKRRLVQNGVEIARINAKILHNEGKLTLKKTLAKKFYYGKKIRNFLGKNVPAYSQVSPLRLSFFKKPTKLLVNPTLTLALFLLKSLELGAAFLGLMTSLISRQKAKF